MNKVEFVKAFAQKEEITQKEATAHVDAFIDTLTDALVAGEKISFVGFGSFDVTERAARKGRNPHDGSEIMIEASKAPRFKSSANLKKVLNV